MDQKRESQRIRADEDEHEVMNCGMFELPYVEQEQKQVQTEARRPYPNLRPL